MEPDFVEAKSDNLPVVEPFMISLFFMDNMRYLSSEIRGIKNVRATRDSYGDAAVGYVQLKRDNSVCIVKAKICPEHKVRSQAYNVTIVIDEAENKVISSECHDCVASSGGCKHAIAFLYWLLRKSEEPSPTAVTCYWKKPLLSKVGTTIKILKCIDLKSGDKPPQLTEEQDFLSKVTTKTREQECEGNLVKYFKSETAYKKLSVHLLHLEYIKGASKSDVNNFVEYCKSQMSDELCRTVEEETRSQYKTPVWFELRYGRITASKIYEASVCSKLDGSLAEQILGAVSLPDTEAIQRGKDLEESVLKVVAEKMKIKLNRTGLILNRQYPLLGASPDAVSDNYVIEVKCPSSDKNIAHYFGKGNINKKYLSQIQLQMLFCGKQLGLFCVASPIFEATKEVDIQEVQFDQKFIEDIIIKSMEFWKNAIYPRLVK